MDCCYAASADKRSVDGTIEVLAACGRETTTIGISQWSFTSRLTEVLRDSRDKPLTIAMLHAKLVNYRRAEGKKKLTRTPIHSIMSDENTPSIRLTPVIGGLITPPLTLDYSDLSEQSSLSDSYNFPKRDPPSARVLIAVSVKEGSENSDEWLQWLVTHMPTSVTGVRSINPEGVFRSHSSLILLSIPVAVWNLLPPSKLYRRIEHITSSNMLFGAPNLFRTEFLQRLPTSRSFKKDETDLVPNTAALPIIRHKDILIGVIETGNAMNAFIEVASGYKRISGHEYEPFLCTCRQLGATFHLIDTQNAGKDAVTNMVKWLFRYYGRADRLNGIIYLCSAKQNFFAVPDLTTLMQVRKTQGPTQTPQTDYGGKPLSGKFQLSELKNYLEKELVQTRGIATVAMTDLPEDYSKHLGKRHFGKRQLEDKVRAWFEDYYEMGESPVNAFDGSHYSVLKILEPFLKVRDRMSLDKSPEATKQQEDRAAEILGSEAKNELRLTGPQYSRMMNHLKHEMREVLEHYESLFQGVIEPALSTPEQEQAWRRARDSMDENLELGLHIVQESIEMLKGWQPYELPK